MNGWPEKSMVDERFLPYYGLITELVIDDDLIFKGHQLVIPSLAKDEMLKFSHKAHVGIEKYLWRMRKTIYWPGMAANMKKFVSNCDVCQKFGNKQQKEPIIKHDVGDYPWCKVGLDLSDLQGRILLVCVDYYSGYIEVGRLTTITSMTVIKLLNEWFARYEIPEKTVSD